MSAVGPELPPHLLAKRKRQAEEEEAASAHPESRQRRSSSSSSTSEKSDKRRRVIGPALPPAALDELPINKPDDTGEEKEEAEDSSSDDDFGPALPSASAHKTTYDDNSIMPSGEDDIEESNTGTTGTKRDEWMMLPPTQDGLAARMDPTKIRARKFNTGKGARAPQGGSGDNTLWTETPEQKRKRLENEVLGVTAPASSEAASKLSRRRENETTAQRIQEHVQKNRGESLMEMHKARAKKEEEDDPSKRSFDREKDMGGGMKISHSKRKELLNHASRMSSRFSGGGYL